MQFTPSILGNEMGVLSRSCRQKKGCSFPQKKIIINVLDTPLKKYVTIK